MEEKKRLILNLELKNFFFKQLSQSLKTASMGWIYSLSHDKEFLIDNLEVKSCNIGKFKKDKKNYNLPLTQAEFCLFQKLQSLVTVESRWKLMKEITAMSNCSLLKDSFENQTDEQALQLAKKFISSNQKFNIVVIGAGCCGLFFANNLKKKLGGLVNILVCDNRIQEPRVKEIYSRNWLTNLPKFLFNSKVDKSITEVFDWFSNSDYIGVNLNMMEVLLLQSCKKIDVKFLFKKDPYDELIINSGIDLIIDATGGKIYQYYPEHETKEILLNIPTNENNTENLSFLLKEKNNYHYPFFLDKPIINYQFKIVGITENLNTIITDYVNKNNRDNLFYVWMGKLIKELNEVLIIINIKESNIKIFQDLLKNRIHINEFAQLEEKIKLKIDSRIIELINLILKNKPIDSQIYLEPPFAYIPRVKLFYKDLPKYHNKIIYPIGDSFYNGNAKVGNGLGMHLLHIEELTKTIEKSLLS